MLTPSFWVLNSIKKVKNFFSRNQLAVILLNEIQALVKEDEPFKSYIKPFVFYTKGLIRDGFE